LSERSKLLFLLLVVVQAVHSVEEYLGRLYDIFPPARYLASLVSENLAAGFIVINLAIISLAACCYSIPVRSGRKAGQVVAWLWLATEFANGSGHVLIAASVRDYFPGAWSGVALMLAALVLGGSLVLDQHNSASSPGASRDPR
jgi:hypothetical protein